MHVLAGVARVRITPAVGTPLVGFIGRDAQEAASSIHDDLFATALVLEAAGPDGNRVVAIVGCDLCMLGDAEVARVRQQLAGLLPGVAHEVVINCAHNHYGPSTLGDQLIQVSRHEAHTHAYVNNLVYLLARVIEEGRHLSAPCTLSYGQAQSSIAVNRRLRGPHGEVLLRENVNGPVDRSVRVIRVDRLADREPLAVLFNYACHVVSLGSNCTAVTADFPAVARGMIEAETGALAVFMQGAAGDVNPVSFDRPVNRSADWTTPRRLGTDLGAATLRAWYSAYPLDVSIRSLRWRRVSLALPRLFGGSEAEIGAEVAELETELATLGDSTAATHDRILWLESRLSRRRQMLAALQRGSTLPAIRAELVALAFDDSTALVSSPGEIFTEIAAAVRKRCGYDALLYSGYSNGYIGYVPTRAAYTEGGFEVTHACVVAPDAGELIADESVRLLRAVTS